MKKILLLSALTCVFFSCSKEKKDGNLNISGEIKGLKQGIIYIQTAKDSSIVTLDSIIFDGKSQFNTFVQIEEPQVLYLTLDRGKTVSEDNNLLFFAEPGKMSINTTLDRFYGDAQIEGSENQKLLEKYNLSKRSLTNKQNDLIKNQILFSKSGNTQKLDSIEKQLQKSKIRIYLNAVNFAFKNNTKEIAPYVALTEIAPISTKYLDTIQKSLPENISNSLYGKALKQLD